MLAAVGSRARALVVVAMPEIERAYLAVRQRAEAQSSVPILARAHDSAASGPAGPPPERTEVIVPEFEAASTLIRHALRRLAVPREKVLAYLELARDAAEVSPSAVAQDELLPRVSEVTLEVGPFADQSLRTARIRERFGVTVVGIIRPDGGYTSHPAPDTVLHAQDRLRIFGLPEQIARFSQALKYEE